MSDKDRALTTDAHRDKAAAMLASQGLLMHDELWREISDLFATLDAALARADALQSRFDNAVCDHPTCEAAIIRHDDGSRRCAAGHRARWVLVTELDAAERDAAAKHAALGKAMEMVRLWHGMGMDTASEQRAWKLYEDNAPEWQPIRAALATSTGARLAELERAARELRAADKEWFEIHDENPIRDFKDWTARINASADRGKAAQTAFDAAVDALDAERGAR